MSVISAADRKAAKLYSHLCSDRKRAVFSAVIIYVITFFAFAAVSLYPVIKETGVLLGGDGAAQYYPCLLDFRRNLIDFLESIKSGNPQFRMMNFGYFFGTDTIASTAIPFIPFLPYYIFVMFVPESAVAGFLSAGVVLISFTAGLSFIYCCSYFKKNLPLSGFMAAFYVFCGNFFYTGVWNPHFLYMYVAFPLMIAGIDRILTGKGWLLFTLSVAWLSIAGLQLLVYTMPFVIIFAAIRVYFLYKGHFFRNLGKYFLRGALAATLGFTLSGAALFIFLQSFFTSVRSGKKTVVDLLELLMPSVDYLTETLGLSEPNTPAGICVALIPCFIYILTSSRVKKEIRVYSLAMLLLIAFPVVRYGLNLFQYELCRWGFIPAMLICFGAVSFIPRFAGIRGEEKAMYFFTIITYTLLLTVRADAAAVIFLLLMAVINIVPVLRKQAVRFAEAAFSKLKTAVRSNSRILLIAGAVIFFALMIAVILIIAYRHYRIEPVLLIAVVVSVAAIAFGAGKKRSNLSLTAILLLCAVVGAIHINSDYDDKAEINENYIVKAVSETEKEKGTFERVANFYSDCYVAGCESTNDSDDTENGTESDEEDLEFVPNRNLMYGIAESEIFLSMLNGNYMTFADRCGLDMTALGSTGQLMGFGAREEMYSLFGVGTMYTDVITDDFYGINFTDKITAEDGSEIYLHKNSYALPAGVTYSKTIDKDKYDSFNSAELTFAIMDSVWLEGVDAAASDKTKYSWECSYDIKQDLRGETPMGIRCYDNYVTPKEDLSGCFVYLSFDGVNCRTFKGAKDESVSFNIDGKNRNFRVHNSNSEWEWTYYTDHYTFPMGYRKNGIEKITFVSPFEFESMKIIAVPEEVYTTAYENCTAETMENMELSTNTITGDITVSSDKVLCVNTLYSEGWTAYVDGVEVPVYKANGLFLGLPLTKGSHTVKFCYRTPWLYEGFAVSGVSIAIIIGVKLLEKRRKKV